MNLKEIIKDDRGRTSTASVDLGMRDGEKSPGGLPLVSLRRTSREEAPRNSKHTFAAKSLILVLIMILISTAFAAMVHYLDPVNNIFRNHDILLLIVATLLTLFLNYTMACVGFSKAWPWNNVILIFSVFTLTIVCGIATEKLESMMVVYGGAATIVTVFVFLILAYSKYDFTKNSLLVITTLVSLIAIALVFVLSDLELHVEVTILEISMVILSVLIYVLIMAVQLRLLFGGKVNITTDDHVYAAFLLYFPTPDCSRK